MFGDIVLELSTEKIRKDFGDLCATIFQIISVQNGCSIQEINSIFIKSNYSLIRSSLLILFQHNIVYLRANFAKVSSINFIIKDISLFSRVYEPIYRLRFTRFLSLAEHEYGMVGRHSMQYFLENGQFFPKALLNHGTFNEKHDDKLEDMLIQMSRDGIIEIVSFTFSVFKNLFVFIPEKKLVKKPLLNKNNHPWKISILRLNLFVRINVIMGIINEYHGYKFLKMIRACVCRTIGVDAKSFFCGWFSVDTLIDDIVEIERSHVLNEIFIVHLIEEFSLENCIINLKEASFNIIFKKIYKIITDQNIENLVYNQFGNKFFLVFNFLKNKNENSEKDLTNKSMLDKLNVRKQLFQMYRLGFIYIEEKGSKFSSVDVKRFFSWKLNFQIIKQRFISEIFKSVYNIILKTEDIELIISKCIIYKKKRSVFSSNNISYQLRAILLSLIRLDEILISFEL